LTIEANAVAFENRGSFQDGLLSLMKGETPSDLGFEFYIIAILGFGWPSRQEYMAIHYAEQHTIMDSNQIECNVT